MASFVKIRQFTTLIPIISPHVRTLPIATETRESYPGMRQGTARCVRCLRGRHSDRIAQFRVIFGPEEAFTDRSNLSDGWIVYPSTASRRFLSLVQRPSSTQFSSIPRPDLSAVQTTFLPYRGSTITRLTPYYSGMKPVFVCEETRRAKSAAPFQHVTITDDRKRVASPNTYTSDAVTEDQRISRAYVFGG